jgi:hypothetical protein
MKVGAGWSSVWSVGGRWTFAVVLVAASLAGAPGARAAGWLPHSADATWTYQWTDSVYSPTPTTEQVTVKDTKGTTFTLAWTTANLNNPADAVNTAGQVYFQETNAGLVNVDPGWTSNPPPSSWPVLCSTPTACGNSLSSTYYNVIWGSRTPVLYEPLLKGTTWPGTGGASNDVSAVSTYLGTEQVSVPAFPGPVTAAKVRSTITQAGALGDPYGSGTRTIWWVYGVGPVKIEFQHSGGTGAAVTTASLQSTNQTPLAPPSDVDYFPFTKGQTLTYRWTNSKHLKQPEVERFTTDAVQNGSARFTVKSVSGPIKVAGTYGFSKRLDGITNLWGTTQSATRLTFPPLGPRSATAADRNHIVTPFDLMTFGFNPILQSYAVTGATWPADPASHDFAIYGVTGSTQVLGLQTVKVPAGTFHALAVRTTLTQAGYPYGSGTRTSWFAPGKGLVKLVFVHGDHSVSTVELTK